MSQQIPAAPVLAQKKELNLFAKSWVGNGQASAVAEALKSNSSLTFVGFRECRAVDDAGAMAIAGALKCNKTLRKLSLESTRVGDRGAAALAQAVPQSGLSRIDLAYCPVGNAGAIAFARALVSDFCPLETLHLDYCTGITDEGAEALLAAVVDNVSCPLTTLGLNGTSISSAMRKRIDLAFKAKGSSAHATAAPSSETKKRARTHSGDGGVAATPATATSSRQPKSVSDRDSKKGLSTTRRVINSVS